MRVYAAVKNEIQLEKAVNSDAIAIFHLQPNIKTLPGAIKLTHNAGKKIFIHMDLAEGIGKDRFGVEYAGELGIDGIISTRANIIKAARENGLFTIQRFFVVDSQAIGTTVETVRNTKPDMIEIMPGIAVKAIGGIEKKISVPIIAGGLIETNEEAQNALSCGAVAISTGKEELWGKSDEF